VENSQEQEPVDDEVEAWALSEIAELTAKLNASLSLDKILPAPSRKRP
jgi:hypothetical protein